MRGLNDSLLRAGLDALYYTRVYHLMATATAGRGAIFALHRVRATPGPDAFAPNRGLEVTLEFLESVLARLRGRGIDIVDLDEAASRLTDPEAPRFAAFTFDDGYADNLSLALPLFEHYRAPFTIFVTTGFLDHDADFWWLVLEHTIKAAPRIRTEISGKIIDLRTGNADEKQAAWDALYWPLRDMSIADRRDFVSALAKEARVDERGLYAREAATWPDLKKAVGKGLVRIGAHTIRNPPLSALSAQEAHAEIAGGRTRLEKDLGQEVRHFAYPFGDRGSAGPREFAMTRDIGFTTSVTMRRGPVFDGHSQHMQALPRVSLNGNFQAMKYLDLFLSGAPFVVWNSARRLNVA